MDSKHNRIYEVVRRVPRGRVSTYGDVAVLAGLPGHARLVGYALHALPEHTTVPWHRVINARGGISLGRAYPGGELLQRRLLEAEGIEFGPAGSVLLERFRWIPDAPPEPATPAPSERRPREVPAAASQGGARPRRRT